MLIYNFIITIFDCQVAARAKVFLPGQIPGTPWCDAATE